MPDFLVFLVVMGGVAALVAGRRKLVARRRQAALLRGEDVVFAVRLVGAEPPYPASPRRGRLRLGPSGLVWSARHGGLVLDLSGTGIRPTSQREGRLGEGLQEDEVVVTAVDGHGVPLRMVGSATTVEQLEGALRARGLPADPVPVVVRDAAAGRGWSTAAHLAAAGLLLLALATAAFTTWARVTGVQVTATVVSEPDSDDYCTVRWFDPRDDRTKDNGADCYWEVGDQVEFVALDDPFRGEVVELEDTYAWAVISGVLASSALGTLGVQHWRRRRDRRRAASPYRPAFPAPAAPDLTADQLRYDEVVAALRSRAAREGWPFERDPSVEPPAARTALTRAASTLGVTWPLALALGFCLVASWTSLAGLWASAGPAVEVVATVDAEPIEIVPFLADDLEVTFPLRAGGTSTTLVSVRGLPDPLPQTLRVAYDPDDPDRARALEHDGAVLGGAAALAALLAGLAWTAWRWFSFASAAREERRAKASGAGRFLPYVLVPDAEENLYLLLFDAGRDAAPGHLLELRDDVRGLVSAAGTVDVRGTYEAGGLVVPLIDGLEVRTSSRLLEADPEDLLGLVNDFAQAVPQPD